MAAKQSQALVVAATVAGIIYVATRKPEAPPGGGGGDGTAVTAQGMVSGVAVNQGGAGMAQGFASMAAARVDKTPGQPITVTLTVSGVGAITALGLRVVWPMRVVTRIGHTTGAFGTLGWKEGQEINVPEFARRFTTIITLANSPVTGTLNLFYTTPNDSGQEWDIHCQLEAQRSDNLGNPIADDWVTVGPEVKLDGAINIIGGVTTAFGQVDAGSISVAQALGARYPRRPLYTTKGW